jgi:hypothetical protein
LLRNMPIPYPDRKARVKIHEQVMNAFASFDEASKLETKAISDVEKEVTGE